MDREQAMREAARKWSRLAAAFAVPAVVALWVFDAQALGSLLGMATFYCSGRADAIEAGQHWRGE